MKTVEGLNGIKATVLAHSVNPQGKNLVTWEIEYPRLILAELNTHRMLSRNSFSSRAVPFNKMLDQLGGEPVRFGANQAGMQDKGEDFDALVEMPTLVPYDDGGVLFSLDKHKMPPRTAWAKAKEVIIGLARPFVDAGYHKQVYNRLLESFQMQKTILSATEVDNFFWLRDDDAADPTIRELAKVMRQAMDISTPIELIAGEWHLPYIDIFMDEEDALTYYIMEDGVQRILTIEQAIKVSCARCAAVSYRNEGYGVDKSIELYERLVGSDKKHASALEHCATPIRPAHGELIDGQYHGSLNIPTNPDTWEPGVSHMDRNRNLWSGNFQGFIQYRKLIPGECYNAS